MVYTTCCIGCNNIHCERYKSQMEHDTIIGKMMKEWKDMNINETKEKNESEITVNVRWFDGKLNTFNATSAPEFGTDILHIRYSNGNAPISWIKIPLREVRWFSMSKESHAQEKSIRSSDILYSRVMIKWFDDYEEAFECSELRVGSDLLWMRLTSGENRHIPLRSVRIIDSMICRSMDFNV